MSTECPRGMAVHRTQRTKTLNKNVRISGWINCDLLCSNSIEYLFFFYFTKPECSVLYCFKFMFISPYHIHNVYIKLFDKQVLHAVICNRSTIMLQSFIYICYHVCLLLHRQKISQKITFYLPLHLSIQYGFLQ